MTHGIGALGYAVNAPNTRPPACPGGRFLFTPTLAGRMRDASLKKFLGRDSRIRVIASPPHLPELWGVRGAVAPAAPGYSGITITAPEHGRRSRRDDSEIEEGWGMRRIRRRALRREATHGCNGRGYDRGNGCQKGEAMSKLMKCALCGKKPGNARDCGSTNCPLVGCETLTCPMPYDMPQAVWNALQRAIRKAKRDEVRKARRAGE